MNIDLSREVVYQIILNDGFCLEEGMPRRVSQWKVISESLFVSSEILHRASHNPNNWDLAIF